MVLTSSALSSSSSSAGFLLFKDFCMNEIDEAVPQLKFYEEVSIPGTLIPTRLIQIRSGLGALTSPLCLWCPFQIRDYEKLDSEEERLSRSRQIYDGYIMKELLSCSHVSVSPRCVIATLCEAPPQPPPRTPGAVTVFIIHESAHSLQIARNRLCQ